MHASLQRESKHRRDGCRGRRIGADGAVDAVVYAAIHACMRAGLGRWAGRAAWAYKRILKLARHAHGRGLCASRSCAPVSRPSPYTTHGHSCAPVSLSLCCASVSLSLCCAPASLSLCCAPVSQSLCCAPVSLSLCCASVSLSLCPPFTGFSKGCAPVSLPLVRLSKGRAPLTRRAPHALMILNGGAQAWPISIGRAHPSTEALKHGSIGRRAISIGRAPLNRRAPHARVPVPSCA
jgi:hypothetical protein